MYTLRNPSLEQPLPDEVLLSLPDNDLGDLAEQYEQESRFLLETEVDPGEGLRIKAMMQALEFCTRQRARCYAVIGARSQRIDQLFKQADMGAETVNESLETTKDRNIH